MLGGGLELCYSFFRYERLQNIPPSKFLIIHGFSLQNKGERKCLLKINRKLSKL